MAMMRTERIDVAACCRNDSLPRDVMTEDGVNGLSLSEARRLGVKPPSLYKYFPSLMAIYDALFLEGQRENLEVMRAAMQKSEPGLPALVAGRTASGQWGLDNRAVAELLFWRPVPSFHPSPARCAWRWSRSNAMRLPMRWQEASWARRRKTRARSTSSRRSSPACSVRPFNEPDLAGRGPSPWFPTLMGLLPAAFPPDP